MRIKIFIIHGTTRPWHSRARRAEWSRSWTTALAHHFKEKIGAECKTFLWSGNLIDPYCDEEIKNCWDTLATFCETSNEASMHTKPFKVLFEKSNGSLLLENALHKYGTTIPPRFFDLELRIATPLKGSKRIQELVKNRYLLYSQVDCLYQFGRLLLPLIHHTYDSYDSRQKKIVLKGLNHSDFNLNIQTKLNTRTISLYDLYTEIISLHSFNDKQG